MEENRLLKRSEVPQENTWKLEDIFASDDEWFKEYESLKELPGRAAEFAGKISKDPACLLEYMKLQDEVGIRLGSLYTYASCRSD